MEGSINSLQATKKLLEDTKLRQAIQQEAQWQVRTDGPAKPLDIIRISSTTTVGDAMRVLASFNILSAPVTDATTNEYIGILDVMDILNGLLQCVYPELFKEGFIERHKRLSMTELETIGLDFSSGPVSSLVHGGDLWYKGDHDSTLLEVVSSGFRVALPPRVHSPHHHLRVHHRVAVFDILPGEQTPDGPIPDWRITNIVSQMDVLRLLASKMGELAANDAGMAARIDSLGMVQGQDSLITVPADTSTLNVLALMHKEHLSGIGIVDPKNKSRLLANLSASDLRGLTPEKFGSLALPVGAFLMIMHPSINIDKTRKVFTYEDALMDAMPQDVVDGNWESVLSAYPLVCCPPSTTLREAIELLVRHGKHRCYVCRGAEQGGEQGQVIGVVTPTDILRAVIMSSKY